MADKKQAKTSVLDQVAERVRSCDNVLVALSKDPSVDELSAALGLTFILDKMGKHATAIFSGAVPNAIEFLEPEKTFETNTNSLQDFIIALDKEKADHLRYKIDGDYVKVYITPYKTTIEESDMEFSHGDYNVDLVVALNVASASDLDSALTEYGRIMHDASSINIAADRPGNFGDLEWGDPKSSSVSEMIYRLSDKLREEGERSLIDKSTATALLAGIVAATNRFSNEHTQPETMAAASKLMMAGADQQLISSSIPVDILTNDVIDATEDAKEEIVEEVKDSTEQKIDHHSSKKEQTLEDELEALEKISTHESKKEKNTEPIKKNTPKASPKKEEQVKKESKPAPTPAPEPIPEPVQEKPVDPTALEVRHGAVDFNPDEEMAPIPEEESDAPEATIAESVAEEALVTPIAEPSVEAPVMPIEAPATPVVEAPVVESTVEPAVVEAPVEPVAVAAPNPAIIDKPALNSPVVIAPEVSPVVREKETHVAEPLSEEDYNAEDHSAENAIDAALQKAAEAARQAEAVSAAEAAQATAQLNQMVAANAAAANTVSPAVAELAAGGKMNLTPPSEATQPPKIPKDYSAMMNAALSEQIQAPAPAAMPAPAPQTAPVQQQAMPVMNDTAAAPIEYASALPMPDPNGILPPPPAPFAPDAQASAAMSAPAAMPAPAPQTAPVQQQAMPVPAELPSAQAFVEQVQADNPAVQAVPATPISSTPTPTMPEPAVAPIMPAVPEDTPTLSSAASISPATNGVNPVMQDQIYPSDPSAFRIPGM